MTYILVPVDNSSASKEAVKEASFLAKRLDLQLYIIHGVEQVTRQQDEQLIQESLKNAEHRGGTILNEMQKEIPEDVEFSADLVYGDDALSAVVDYIEAEKDYIEYVFIGHRRRNGREKQLVGSFAESLIEYSPLPVTVVSVED